MMNIPSIILVLGSSLALANAQLCPDGSESVAPCFDGTCQPGTNSACDPTGQLCCVNAVATTVPSVIDNTGSTVFNPFSTISTNNFGTVRPSVITGSSTCVDLLNPATGVSDCPQRASLCNDPTYQSVMTQQCPRTCGRCTNTNTNTNTNNNNNNQGTNSASCVDKVNPATGVSDCSRRASLCNDPTYQTVMTQQCPRTCGRCTTNSVNGVNSGSGTSNNGVSGANGANTNSAASGNCVDRVNPATGVSDCARRASLCNDPTYQTVMNQQCPRTCGRCTATSTNTNNNNNQGTNGVSGTGTNGVGTNNNNNNINSNSGISGSCVDLVNPRTGVSDCPSNVNRCNDVTYAALMRVQCPRTCGFCGSSSTTARSVNNNNNGLTSTTSRACVDLINPRTGTSDCPRRSGLCNNVIYQNVMRTQCPRTCGFC